MYIGLSGDYNLTFEQINSGESVLKKTMRIDTEEIIFKNDFADKYNGIAIISKTKQTPVELDIISDFAYTTDNSYFNELNSILYLLSFSKYIKIDNIIAEYAIKNITIKHDKGCFRRTGVLTISLELLTSYFLEEKTITKSFTTNSSAYEAITLSLNTIIHKIKIHLLSSDLISPQGTNLYIKTKNANNTFGFNFLKLEPGTDYAKYIYDYINYSSYYTNIAETNKIYRDTEILLNSGVLNLITGNDQIWFWIKNLPTSFSLDVEIKYFEKG